MKRGKLAGMTGLFLALMLLFTVLSRAADSAGIANVTLGRPQNMMIAHEVCGSGRVEQNQECAVVTEAGQRVGTVYVNEGQQVEKGGLLFDLDLDSLEESILEKKQEIQKLELQMKDLASQESVNEKQRSNAQAQASENYSLSVSRASASLSHAEENLRKAQKELKEYREKEGVSEEDTLAEQELEQICEECSAAYIQAQQDLQTLQWRIEKAVDDALQKNGGAKVQNIQVKTGSPDAGEVFPEVNLDTGKEAQPDVDGEAEQILTEAESGLKTLETDSLSDSAEPAGVNEEDENTWTDEVLIIEDVEVYDDPGNSPENDQWIPDAGDLTGTGSNSGADSPGSSQWTSDIVQDPAETGNGSGTADSPGNSQWTSDAVQDPDRIEQSVREQYAPELEKAEKAVADALEKKQKAEAALEDCRQKMLAARGSQNAGEEQQLIDAVRAAQMAYEDAAIAANEAAVTGNRGVETAGLPEAENSTDDIYELDLEQMKRELSKLEDLEKADGKVAAPVDGIVTGVYITAGERTPDSTAVMLADLTKGCRLTAEIPQEQEKYISRGDLVTVKSGDGKTTLEEIPVESIAAKAEDETVRLVTVQIPEGKLQIGMAAELSLTKKSAAYPLCIPLSALYLDEKNQPYVLAVQEINSVLGTEMQALKVAVVVEERNDSYAALSQGSITSSQSVIVSSDRAIGEGSRVRVAD